MRSSHRLSLAVAASDTPLGIATSSGTVGHSLSFGRADSATVIARDPALADACATALGNRVGSKSDMAGAIASIRSVSGVQGALVVFRSAMAAWGRVTLV